MKVVLRRLALAATTVLIGGLLSATLVCYAPGVGTHDRAPGPRLSSENLATIRDISPGERGIASYYVGYLRCALHGDLGVSRSFHRPVRTLLGERAGVTCRLAGKALLVAWLAALMLVCMTTLLRVPAVSQDSVVGSSGWLCLPAGALALLAIILNAPGYLVLACILFPRVHRYFGNLIAATARMPHVVGARARGISKTRILLWHVVPVVRREVLALAGVSAGLALSAAIPVEALCGIAGIGQLAWQSAMARDLPLLINLSILVIPVVTLANSGADLLVMDRRQPV